MRLCSEAGSGGRDGEDWSLAGRARGPPGSKRQIGGCEYDMPVLGDMCLDRDHSRYESWAIRWVASDSDGPRIPLGPHQQLHMPRENEQEIRRKNSSSCRKRASTLIGPLHPSKFDTPQPQEKERNLRRAPALGSTRRSITETVKPHQELARGETSTLRPSWASWWTGRRRRRPWRQSPGRAGLRGRARGRRTMKREFGVLLGYRYG